MTFAFIDVRSSAGWEEWTHDGSTVEEGGVVLKEASPTYVLAERLTPPGIEAIDLDLGSCGNLYVLDAKGDVYKHDRRTGAPERLPWIRREDDRLSEPSALCVTGRVVFVADAADRSVRAVSKDRLRTVWSEDEAFDEPVGLDADGEIVYVIDEGTGSDGGSLARIEPDGEVRTVTDGLTAPEDVTVDETGTVYVLHYPDGKPEILRFGSDWSLKDDRSGFEDAVWLSSRSTDRAAAFEVSGTGERFTPSCIEVSTDEGVSEVIAAVGPMGSDEWALFRYSAGGGGFEKLPSFRRSCVDLLVGREETNGEGRGLYVIEGRSRAVDFLEARSRNEPRGNEASNAAAYRAEVTTTLDSGSAGTQWHRVTLDLRLGGSDADGGSLDSTVEASSEETTPGRDTQVYLRYYATDVDPEGVATTGAERTTAADWKRVRKPNPGDVLLTDAVGRYLRVGLELVGSEFSSPRIESFRAYLPRTSYLRYLPAIYREDARSADFLGRFLAVFESVFTDVEAEIEGVTEYFDPYGIPAGPDDEYLSWLGSWVGVETDEAWPESAKRELVSRASELFRERGTRSGVLEMLRIYLDHAETPNSPHVPLGYRNGPSTGVRATRGGDDPANGGDTTARAADGSNRDRNRGQDRVYLLESPDLDCIDRTDGEHTAAPFDRLLDHPYSFLLLVRPPVSDEQMRTIERIVASEKPAHAVGRVIELRPWMELGRHTFLGVNSALSAPGFTLGVSGIGEDSKLSAGPDYLRRETNRVRAEKT